VRLEWFLGKRGLQRTRISAFYLDPPVNRGKGLLEWNGLIIRLPPDDTTRNSYAYVYHQCPIISFKLGDLNYRIMYPWTTQTLFYEGKG